MRDYGDPAVDLNALDARVNQLEEYVKKVTDFSIAALIKKYGFNAAITQFVALKREGRKLLRGNF